MDDTDFMASITASLEDGDAANKAGMPQPAYIDLTQDGDDDCDFLSAISASLKQQKPAPQTRAWRPTSHRIENVVEDLNPTIPSPTAETKTPRKRARSIIPRKPVGDASDLMAAIRAAQSQREVSKQQSARLPDARKVTSDESDLMVAVRASLGPSQGPSKADGILVEPFDPIRFLQPSQCLSPKERKRPAGRRAEDAEDLKAALKVSLGEQSISDVPPHEWPVVDGAECSVCTEVLPPVDLVIGRLSSACDHSRADIVFTYICKSCVGRHLDIQVNQSGSGRVTCPLCLAELSHSDIKKWASPATFARYDQLRLRDTVSSDPKFIWCSNPACTAGQVHASGAEAPIVICQSCGTRTCFRHQRAWHDGLTCDEFDDPNKADERKKREQAELEDLCRQQREEERRIREQVKRDAEIARRLAEEDARQDAERHRKEEEQQRRLKEEEERRRREEKKRLKEEAEAEKRRLREEAEAEKQRKKRQQEEEARAKVEREERMARLKEEKQGEAAVMSSSKACPGIGCGFRIVKHMTCEFRSSVPFLVPILSNMS
jgi:hypothetical protein